MDEFNKKHELKQLWLFILLWVFIFGGLILYSQFLNHTELAETHQYCAGMNLSMQECKTLWRTIPVLR